MTMERLICLTFVLLLGGTAALAEPGSEGQQGRGMERQHGDEQDGRRPVVGKITAIRGQTLEVAALTGGNIEVKLTDKTQFRKDRNPAKLSDFKVGDLVLVRGPENPDGSVAADVVATRTGAVSGPGAMRGGPAGTLGKDFVVGEVKSVDAPSLTVLRPDNVTQKIELNEETSLRRGRESITMADIQVGDHVMARGSIENNVFVPKGVFVIGPEQWKRMQELGFFDEHGAPAKPGSSPNTKPPEPRH
jgi:hypothetical protein